MARPRSLVIRIEVDRVKHAHNCQGNSRHRLQGGEIRLKVRKGRSWEHYCLACAQAIVGQNIEVLQAMADNLASGKVTFGEEDA